MREDEKERLDRSIQDLETLLKDAGPRGSGEPLDTSRLKKVASEMQVKAQELRSMSEEYQLKIDAAREQNAGWRSRSTKIRLGIYVVALVGVAAYFMIFGK